MAPIEIPVIATYGEKIYPHIRNILRKAFTAKFIEYYANRENSIAAVGESIGIFCEVSEYCHLEIDQATSFEGRENTSNLLSTSLHNYAMLLIRYCSEDIVKWIGYAGSDDRCPSLELLGGRGKDPLLSRDGLIAPYLPNIFEHKEFNRPKKYQLVQVSLDELIIRIVPLEKYDRKTDEPLLLKYFNQVLGRKFHLKFEYVDDIPFTQGGKYPMAVSSLATNYIQSQS